MHICITKEEKLYFGPSLYGIIISWSYLIMSKYDIFCWSLSGITDASEKVFLFLSQPRTLSSFFKVERKKVCKHTYCMGSDLALLVSCQFTKRLPFKVGWESQIGLGINFDDCECPFSINRKIIFKELSNSIYDYELQYIKYILFSEFSSEAWNWNDW